MDCIKSGAISIPALLGPTATGKTAAAIPLAKEWGGEVISADSIQVYRGLNIGSAKPTGTEREGNFHHMGDVWQPEEEASVAR